MLKSLSILLISERQKKLSGFTEALQKDSEVDLLAATTVEDAIHLVDFHAPALIIVDEQVEGFAGLDLVRRLIEVNAFANTAVLSTLTEKDFHRCSEGLGILTKLPIQPGTKDALRLLDLLQQLRSNI